MSNGTASALNSERGLASMTAQGGLSRLAVARLKSAGVPVVALLRRVGLTPEVIADPEERLIVRSQIRLLDEAAIALQDECLGFTLARDFDPRALGLLYYVMASSQTLSDALKRVARYSQSTLRSAHWRWTFRILTLLLHVTLATTSNVVWADNWKKIEQSTAPVIYDWLGGSPDMRATTGLTLGGAVIAVGDRGLIRRSDDAGRTWANQPSRTKAHLRELRNYHITGC